MVVDNNVGDVDKNDNIRPFTQVGLRKRESDINGKDDLFLSDVKWTTDRSKKDQNTVMTSVSSNQ